MANSDKLCMGCMNPLPEGREECGICGYPVNGENPDLYLPVHTLLSDRYVVGRVLEAGGDAALYMGYDQVLKAPILVREFLPDTLCERGEDDAIRVISGCEHTFQDYLERFRNHARALARMRDLSAMAPVYDIFEQNNTAYTVSEYVEGISLETRLAQNGGRMRWEEARPLFMPLLSSLSALHAAGIVHLGICPDNLFIGGDGRLRLRGFAIAEARTVSTDLKPQLLSGYSAPEQYGFELTPGAAADVYGVAATLFRTLTGNPPPDGASRAKNSSDLFVPADVAKELPDHVAAALFGALQVEAEKRTPTITAFRDELAAAPSVTALIEDDKPAEPEEADSAEEPPVKPKNPHTKYAILIVVCVFVFLLLAAGAVILLLFPDLIGGKKVESSDLNSMPAFPTIGGQASSTYVEHTKQYAVPDVRTKNFYDIKDEPITGDLKLKIAYKQFSDKPKGTILSQSPNAEESVGEGTEIQVVISDGPDRFPLPDVTGWKVEQAKAYLEALGFRVDTMPLQVSDFDKGLVQDAEPAVGETLEVGSKVTLRYSDVEKPTEPPQPDPTEPPADGGEDGGNGDVF